MEKLQRNCYSLPVGCPEWTTPWEIQVFQLLCKTWTAGGKFVLLGFWHIYWVRTTGASMGLDITLGGSRDKLLL